MFVYVLNFPRGDNKMVHPQIGVSSFLIVAKHVKLTSHKKCCPQINQNICQRGKLFNRNISHKRNDFESNKTIK